MDKKMSIRDELEQLLLDFVRRVSKENTATPEEIHILPSIAAVLSESINQCVR